MHVRSRKYKEEELITFPACGALTPPVLLKTRALQQNWVKNRGSSTDL